MVTSSSPGSKNRIDTSSGFETGLLVTDVHAHAIKDIVAMGLYDELPFLGPAICCRIEASEGGLCAGVQVHLRLLKQEYSKAHLFAATQ